MIKWTVGTILRVVTTIPSQLRPSHLPFVRYVVQMSLWDYVGDLEGLWEYAWGQSVGDNLLNSVYAIGKCVQDFMADEKIHKPTLLGPHFALLVRKCSKFVFFRPVLLVGDYSMALTTNVCNQKVWLYEHTQVVSLRLGWYLFPRFRNRKLENQE